MIYRQNQNIFYKQQSGQTLVETVVAIFMLTMGITAAVGLANYAFSNSTLITKQIIGVGLAREGIEMVKNMRDTNWLQQTAINTTCYNFSTTGNDAKCYNNWLTQLFNINSVQTTHNRIVFSPPTSASPYFSIDNVASGSGNQNKYGLNFSNATTSPNFAGYYTQPVNGVFDGTPDTSGTRYYRDVQITVQTTAPYDKANMQRLYVQSQVWWTDKKCFAAPNYATAIAGCKVELDTYLTNWKNY